jgi:hypothetical protein
MLTWLRAWSATKVQVDLTVESGAVQHERISMNDAELSFQDRNLVGLSQTFAALTNVASLMVCASGPPSHVLLLTTATAEAESLHRRADGGALDVGFAVPFGLFAARYCCIRCLLIEVAYSSRPISSRRCRPRSAS